MKREIITTRDLGDSREASIKAAPPGPEPPPQQKDPYLTKLLKYIPAETIAAYAFFDGVIKSFKNESIPSWVLWTVFGVILVLTPVYLHKFQGVRKPLQLFISFLSFGVWVFSMGGPFVTLAGYKSFYGAIFMPLFTFAVASIDPEKQKAQQS